MATVHLHRDDLPDTLALNAPVSDRTHSALADRGFVRRPVASSERALPGRAAPSYIHEGAPACALLDGLEAYKAPPAGTPKEWHWRALAKATTPRVTKASRASTPFTRIGERTWQRLLE
jgi:hypothetical protein